MNEELFRRELDTHDNRLNNHSDRIKDLERKQVAFAIQIENLCADLKDLTSTLKWFIGIMFTTFLGFFIYAVQSGLFK